MIKKIFKVQDPLDSRKNPNNYDPLDLPAKITNYDMNLIKIMDILGSVTLRICSDTDYIIPTWIGNRILAAAVRGRKFHAAVPK